MLQLSAKQCHCHDALAEVLEASALSVFFLRSRSRSQAKRPINLSQDPGAHSIEGRSRTRSRSNDNDNDNENDDIIVAKQTIKWQFKSFYLTLNHPHQRSRQPPSRRAAEPPPDIRFLFQFRTLSSFRRLSTLSQPFCAIFNNFCPAEQKAQNFSDLNYGPCLRPPPRLLYYFFCNFFVTCVELID